MNIVFDLGGVVFSWQPDALIRRVFDDFKTQKLVRSELIDHPDWVELDKGTMTLRQAIDRSAARTGLPRSDVEQFLEAVPPSLKPINETIELIREVRTTDNRLFVLSNMPLETMAYLEKNHRIWDLFDGIVISSRIRKVKPEIEIYEHLLSQHQLEAGETIFIDDMSENLAAAASIGIQTIQFVDPFQCRQALLAFGHREIGMRG